MKLVIAMSILAAGLVGCVPSMGTKAPKACGDFAYEDVCARKDHCAWSGTACVDK